MDTVACCDRAVPANRSVNGAGFIVPKCKIISPERLSPGVGLHLSSFASASLFRDASEGEGDDRLFLQCVQRPSSAVSGCKRGATAPHERGLRRPRMQRPVRPLRSHHQADHGRKARLRSRERKHALTHEHCSNSCFAGGRESSNSRREVSAVFREITVERPNVSGQCWP